MLFCWPCSSAPEPLFRRLPRRSGSRSMSATAPITAMGRGIGIMACAGIGPRAIGPGVTIVVSGFPVATRLGIIGIGRAGAFEFRWTEIMPGRNRWFISLPIKILNRGLRGFHGLIRGRGVPPQCELWRPSALSNPLARRSLRSSESTLHPSIVRFIRFIRVIHGYFCHCRFFAGPVAMEGRLRTRGGYFYL